MYKAVLLFASGIFSGALGTYLMLSPLNPAVDLNPQFAQLNKSINSLVNRTVELEIAMQALPYPQPATMTRAPARSMASASPGQAMQGGQTVDADTGQAAQQGSGKQNTATATVEPEPTSEQMETYRAIDTQLSGASNNYSADLSGLLEQAEGLTNSQRSELTRKATQMINDGQLKPEQFNANARTTM